MATAPVTIPAPSWQRFLLTEVSVPPGPTAIQSQRKHTEVYINYKLDGLLAQALY